MKANQWLLWLSIAFIVATAMFLFCFNSLVRKVPQNYILLFVFTVFNSYMISALCIFAEPENILIAGVLTFAVFFGLTVIAFFV
jgi:FtsH-binding integral membrane protein